MSFLCSSFKSVANGKIYGLTQICRSCPLLSLIAMERAFFVVVLGTVVEQPIEKMAQESCRLLLEHIADGYRRIEEIALRGETVIREST